MATFCVEFNMAPAEFWNLRADEFDALIDELKIRQKQKAARRG